jgi:hypothetical protein
MEGLDDPTIDKGVHLVRALEFALRKSDHNGLDHFLLALALNVLHRVAIRSVSAHNIESDSAGTGGEARHEVAEVDDDETWNSPPEIGKITRLWKTHM